MSRRKHLTAEDRARKDLFRGTASARHRLEHAVVSQMVPANFGPMDLVEFLLDAEHIETLKRACSLLKSYDVTPYAGETVLVSASERASFAVKISIQCPKLGMAGWRSELSRPHMEHPKAASILTSLEALADVHDKFNLLSQCIDWLDLHATLGAARYYASWLGPLLTPGHAFFLADGKRFREPTEPVGPWLQKFRTCATTVTEALLCPDVQRESSGVVTLDIGGTYISL